MRDAGWKSDFDGRSGARAVWSEMVDVAVVYAEAPSSFNSHESVSSSAASMSESDPCQEFSSVSELAIFGRIVPKSASDEIYAVRISSEVGIIKRGKICEE